jgi:hypothetical protein
VSFFNDIGSFLSNPVGGLVDLFRDDTRRLQEDTAAKKAESEPTPARVAYPSSGGGFSMAPASVYENMDRGMASDSSYSLQNALGSAGLYNPAASMLKSDFSFNPVQVPGMSATAGGSPSGPRQPTEMERQIMELQGQINADQGLLQEQVDQPGRLLQLPASIGMKG